MIPRMRGEPPRDLSKPLEEVKIEVDATLAGERLDVALASRLFWRSRSSVLHLIQDGLVVLEGRTARKSTRLRRGEVVRVRVPPRPEPEEPVAPDRSDIHILYQDKWMVAVDKPAGLAVHPAGRRVHGTLIHWLHTQYRRPDDRAHDVVPRLLHRIDRETSGLLLASLNPDLHSHVAMQFEEREVQKTYQAVVHGAPPQQRGVIDLGIGPDKTSQVKLKLAASTDGSGMPALTHYELLARNERFSLLELRPKTGRTHQLRVHLAAIGCPLVGDKIYGVEDEIFLSSLRGDLSEANRARLILDRHALHSSSVTFYHPFLEREMTLRAPLHDDMAALVTEGAAPR